MERETPRSPTEAERAVVEFLLPPEILRSQAIQSQIHAMSVQSNCTCGCGSFTIVNGLDADSLLTSAIEAWDAARGISMGFISAGGSLAVEITYFAGESEGIPEDFSSFERA